MKQWLRILGSFALFYFISSLEAGVAPLPQAPATNPHPPITAEDIKGVNFGEEAVKELLMKTLPPPPYRAGAFPAGFQNKDLACIKDSSCYVTDPDFTAELVQMHKTYGPVIEMRHAHLIPWSMKRMNMRSSVPDQPPGEKRSSTFAEATPQLKPDEFMVHIYVRYKNKPETWYHLDVILSEDAKGKLYLRHFFTTALPSGNAQLPPGVVCQRNTHPLPIS